MSFILILGVIVFIVVAFIENYKNDTRTRNILKYCITLAISGILFALSVPTIKHSHPSHRPENCLGAQRLLSDIIQKYNEDHKDNQFPKNCNKDELKEYQEDLLIKNNYMKKNFAYVPKECSLEIKDSHLFCSEHGSYKFGSPFFTAGFPIKDTYYHKSRTYGKKIREQKEKERKEAEDKAMQRDCIISGLLILLASFKILYYIIMV